MEPRLVYVPALDKVVHADDLGAVTGGLAGTVASAALDADLGPWGQTLLGNVTLRDLARRAPATSPPAPSAPPPEHREPEPAFEEFKFDFDFDLGWNFDAPAAAPPQPTPSLEGLAATPDGKAFLESLIRPLGGGLVEVSVLGLDGRKHAVQVWDRLDLTGGARSMALVEAAITQMAGLRP